METNPFNRRLFGNYNANRLVSGFHISHGGKEAKNLQVPNQDQPVYGSPEWETARCRQNELTVPDTSPDFTFGETPVRFGFVSNRPDLFVMHDGSIISFKTGRIVNRTVKKQISPNMIMPGHGEWGAVPSVEQIVSELGKTGATQTADEDPNIDEYSKKYWKTAVEQAKKLESEMTPEQKTYLQAFEAHFPKSKFIEEK